MVLGHSGYCRWLSPERVIIFHGQEQKPSSDAAADSHGEGEEGHTEGEAGQAESRKVA